MTSRTGQEIIKTQISTNISSNNKHSIKFHQLIEHNMRSILRENRTQNMVEIQN